MLNDGAHFGMLFDTAEEGPLKLLASARQPLELFMPETYPLAREEAIWPAQIASQRLVLPEANSRLLEIIHSVFTERGLPLNVVMKSSSLQLVLESVAQGTGLSILPQIFGNPSERPCGIVARPILCDEFSDIHFHFFSRSGRRMNPAALALQNAIVREVQAMHVVDLKRALA